MAALKDKGAPERERMIMSIADDAASRLDHSMLAAGKLTIPQQSFVVIASTDVGFGSWLRQNAEIEFANGNFVSTSINLKNKSAGDGCRDKTIEKTILRAFRARTFSRSQGSKDDLKAQKLFLRCTPETGHRRTGQSCRFRANNRHPEMKNVPRTTSR